MADRWLWGILGGSLLGLGLGIVGFITGVIVAFWLWLPQSGGPEGVLPFLVHLPLLLLAGAVGGICGGVGGATLGALWAGKGGKSSGQGSSKPPIEQDGPS